MKTYLILLFAAIAMASCGGTESNNDKGGDENQKEKKSVVDEIKVELDESLTSQGIKLISKELKEYKESGRTNMTAVFSFKGAFDNNLHASLFDKEGTEQVRCISAPILLEGEGEEEVIFSFKIPMVDAQGGTIKIEAFKKE